MRDFTKHAPEYSPINSALRWHLYANRTKSAQMRSLAIYQCEGWKAIARSKFSEQAQRDAEYRQKWQDIYDNDLQDLY